MKRMLPPCLINSFRAANSDELNLSLGPEKTTRLACLSLSSERSSLLISTLHVDLSFRASFLYPDVG